MAKLKVAKPALEVPRVALRGSTWIKPELVAEIAYTEFTGDGILRHPSFLGLREDKAAKQVVLETPVPLRRRRRARPSCAPRPTSSCG